MIMIKSASIQFKNPRTGQPTRAIEAHYNGRRIEAIVNGKEELFRFDHTELPFNTDEDGMIEAIRVRVAKQ